MILASCQFFGGGGRAYDNDKDLSGLVEELKDKFGQNAGFTSITMSYHDGIGTSTVATGGDINSNKLTERLKQKGIWQDKAEVTLEIDGEATPKDFMFTLDQVQDLRKIPGLVKSSIEKVEKEKKITDLVSNMVSVSMPSRIDTPGDELRITVYVSPKNGGTDFTLLYNQKGEFLKMMH
ncbi:hypothetical protein EG028_25605 [Chitinophaga barathri]|uniref:Uncharacterized protein n=2 Tax=Chitinophaga barathri TaxID=1647451 RepID=A0A3N4M518_9BACT|nr:hypothetical protein EG028_25605 [Chitinophaga barathri]